MLDKVEEFVNEPLPRKFLFFDEMITPSLVQAAYWLGLVCIAWMGLEKLLYGGFFGIFEAVIFVLFASIALRVIAEMVMLFFKMNATMEVVAENTKPSPASTASASTTVRKKRKKVSKKITKKPSGE
jgi:predicted lipid-binding transport protein (Tim44 family)